MKYFSIREDTITDIADAIRNKTGSTAKMGTDEMAVAIDGITGGGTEELPIAEDAFFGTPSVVLEKAFTISATTDSNSRLNSGINFSVLENVAIYEIRYSGANIAHEFAIWDSAGVMLWSKTVTPNQEPTIVFTEPFVLHGGSSYTISLRKTGDMSYRYSGVSAVSNKISNPRHVYCSYNDGLVCPTKSYSYGFPFEVYIGDAVTESVTTEYKIQTETMNNLADAIREKAGVSQTISPSQMIAIVDAVNLTLQEKTVTPTEEVQEVTPDAGYFGLSKVTVGAAAGKELPIAEQATFGGNEADIPYEIQGASLTAIADQVQRLAKTENNLTPDGMTATLQGIKSSLELNDAENNKFGSVAATYDYGVTYINFGDTYTGGWPANKSCGYRFTVGESFAVYGFRSLGFNTFNYIYTLWDSNGNALRTGSYRRTAGSKTWEEFLFDAPLNLTVGETYVVSVYQTSQYANYYTKKGGYTTNGKLLNVESVTAEDAGIPTTVDTSGKLHGVIDIIIGAPVSGEVPTEYKIQRTSLTSIVDEVNRITGGTAQLSPAQIITALQAVPVQTS